MLIITGVLLSFTYFKNNTKGEVTFAKSLIIGLAQAIAIMPGISRSGATISTALLVDVDKEKATKFSFLMVLPPILGAMLLKTLDFIKEPEIASSISSAALATGFIAAFVSGIIACSWMIHLVKKGKLIYFAIYCFVIGISVLLFV